ncbi:phosphoglycerate mutase-like protein [Trametes versicolor FP-101664 SS1]|uniref:phosphoglycerate mutase-like protein n=1 Tax=Trametes versicolor (strain FP-101664) TaxID=717944 RepID=UPI00046215A5|nr:phosphoglycerate mutase-like protein [Trametes versicolor FP-101664 SS1]EIW59094.1 phosphoglycerate mutase-like protein [Trametes versicolor FP-101664 SS1]
MGERTFSIATGYFLQDDPTADGDVIGALPDRFGLLDDSEDRWGKFAKHIQDLNDAAPEGTRYKVFFLVRHGQGYHNVAEAKYGTTDWDNYWSKLNGDEDITWGPDPELTAVGVAQAVAARQLWEAELKYGLPLPTKHYASPMRRALQTWREIFVNSGMLRDSVDRVTMIENLREEYGVHTCDKRFSRAVIARDFPPPTYEFEDGFSEEDEIWQEDERESKPHIKQRAQGVLSRIFAQDIEEDFICITAHSGIINGFLAAFGRPRYPLPTGGILPLVIKGVES